MRRLAFIAVMLLLPLLTLAPTKSALSISCRSASYLTDSRPVSGSNTTCYRFAAPRNSNLLEIKLESSSGATDLFVREGTVSSLNSGDLVTASPTTGQATYVVLDPSATTYTIAAVPPSTRGSFRLVATTASPGNDRPSFSCSGSSCTATYPLGRSIKLGPRYGDQLIFPVEISSSGRVVGVRATWSGTARSLALDLHGPGTNSASPTKSYADTSGRSPLSLSYNLTTTDLRRGDNWRVTLMNDNQADGSISNGSLVISYTREPATLRVAPTPRYFFVAPNRRR